MVPDAREFEPQYRDYLARFDQAHAGTGVGAFVKHRGRLVKKLSYDEFEPMFSEYRDVEETYTDSLERGDTINDVVVKVLRERAIELFFDPPM